jgi:hypothetical protein
MVSPGMGVRGFAEGVNIFAVVYPSYFRIPWSDPALPRNPAWEIVFQGEVARRKRGCSSFWATAQNLVHENPENPESRRGRMTNP